ncbi:MAG TPA: DUF4911 domain-containing protein, partial [Candidatus Binatia bacterium]
EIYFTIRPEDIAYVKFVLESYDGVGIIRTVDRRKAIIVALVVEDFLASARALFAALKDEVAIAEIPRPADIGDDWLMQELSNDIEELKR